MAATTRELQLLLDFLRETGIGALPLLDGGAAPSEAQLLANTGRAVQSLYERHRRLQESAGVVAALLAAGEAPGRR